MTLRLDILRLLKERGRLRFYQIANETLGDNASARVTTANCLKILRQKGLVRREYKERESWYEITKRGLRHLVHVGAVEEIQGEPSTFFSNVDVVVSSDGTGDASVYWNGPIDLFSRKQIGDILAKHPGIKILGHKKKR